MRWVMVGLQTAKKSHLSPHILVQGLLAGHAFFGEAPEPLSVDRLVVPTLEPVADPRQCVAS